MQECWQGSYQDSEKPATAMLSSRRMRRPLLGELPLSMWTHCNAATDAVYRLFIWRGPWPVLSHGKRLVLTWSCKGNKGQRAAAASQSSRVQIRLHCRAPSSSMVLCKIAP